jgi:hypothetical protein
MIVQFDSSEDKTARALLALGDDVRQLIETAESVRLQYNALAERHGLSPCLPSPS